MLRTTETSEGLPLPPVEGGLRHARSLSRSYRALLLAELTQGVALGCRSSALQACWRAGGFRLAVLEAAREGDPLLGGSVSGKRLGGSTAVVPHEHRNNSSTWDPKS